MTEVLLTAGPVDPLRMSLLALLLEDPNPIHLDPEAARRSGLGDRVVNQGPANIALMVNALREAFPASRIVALRLRFLLPVLAGDVVVVRLRTPGAAEGSSGGVCEVRLERPDGHCAVIGEAELDASEAAGVP